MNMSMPIDGAGAGAAPAATMPESLIDWRACAADLHQKQQENSAEANRLALLRQELALPAARGDMTARKRIARLAAEENGLQLCAASLTQGLAVVAQEISTAEAGAAEDARSAELAQYAQQLTHRLTLIDEIERRVRAIAPLLARLGDLTTEIETAHAALGGARPILPPLAQEAVGGRLAEFMAGGGFAAWLPLPRPEIRPALASWVAAERDVQEAYQLPA
mgnify:CR=1 FL=1|nr:hypothetical protein [uncultured Dongia sp.]